MEGVRVIETLGRITCSLCDTTSPTVLCENCQNEPREDFYLLSLAKLKDFGADYDAIKSKNLDISRIINTFTTATEPVTEFNPIDHEIAELSRNLLLSHPNPAIRKLVPISVNGDGDCLFYTLQVFYPDMS
ncbi:unnamed protein product, partial [Didymodactylos carnosus]